MYRNPSERVDWFDRCDTAIDAVCLEAGETILLGDFNASLLNSDARWNQLCESFNFHPLITNTNYR